MTTSTSTTASGTRGRIVVGVDGSTASRAALSWAIAQCRLAESTLELISVYSPAGELAYGFGAVGFSALPLDELERAAASILQDAAEAVPVELRTATRTRPVCDPSASHALTHAAEGATLLVVGAHRRLGLGMLGSTAVACLKHAACPVVVVPPPAEVREPVLESATLDAST